jgi:hypothetical protein
MYQSECMFHKHVVYFGIRLHYIFSLSLSLSLFFFFFFFFFFSAHTFWILHSFVFSLF